MKIRQENVRWHRIRRSGLVDHFSSAPEAAKALVGVQAQILPAAGLALFNRCPSVTDQGLEAMLHADRTLVRLWGQRGTLHLYACEDWPLLIAARSQRLSEWEGGTTTFGLTRKRYDEVVRAVEELLEENDTLGRKGLLGSGLRLPPPCYSPWGGIYAMLVMKGLACHARREGGEGRFAHRRNWLPDLAWDPPTYDEASLELVRRYTHTYGPVDRRDLAWWLGAKATDVRRWMRELDDELVTVEVGREELRMAGRDVRTLKETPPGPGRWPLTMLYRFDPLLLGYRDRSWIVEDRYRDRVSRPAGHIEGVVLSPHDGMACATWRYAREAGGISVTVDPFDALSEEVKRAIKARSKAVAGYFGLPLKKVTFRRP